MTKTINDDNDDADNDSTGVNDWYEKKKKKKKKKKCFLTVCFTKEASDAGTMMREGGSARAAEADWRIVL